MRPGESQRWPSIFGIPTQPLWRTQLYRLRRPRCDFWRVLESPEAALAGTAISHGQSPSFFPVHLQIEDAGTLDGGIPADRRSLLSRPVAAHQRGRSSDSWLHHLAGQSYTSSVIVTAARDQPAILHLKSGISYIGENTIVAMEEMAGNELFRNYELIRVSVEESYAANCVRVNERVLVAAEIRASHRELADREFNPLVLEMSEFQKMDGGLSCLSLRF